MALPTRGLLLAFVCLSALLSLAHGATYNLTPTTAGWQTTLSTLQPGDVAILSAGTFTLNSQFKPNFPGTSSQPIEVVGAGKDVTIIQMNANQNIMDVAGNSCYFTVHNMSFTGGSRGIRLLPGVHHATFQDIHLHDTQETCFAANDAGAYYHHLTLRRMEIHNCGVNPATGECIYLGCSADGCRVSDSLIELNYCHDTSAAQPGWGSGIQVKTGSYNNVIKNNVLANNGAPGVLIYDDYGRGANLVEGNVILGTQDAGIQLTSGAHVRNNIIVGAKTYGIFVSSNSIQNAGAWHDIEIVHNTIYNSGTYDIYLPSLSGSQFVVVNNALLSSTSAFNSNSQSGITILKNAYVSGSLPSGASGGGFQVTIAAVIDAAGNNFYPSSGSPLINAGSTSYPSPVSDDFNETPRSSTPTVGAYEYTTATNPGWTIAKGFKGGVAPSSGGGDGPSSASALTGFLGSLIKEAFN